MPAFLKMIQMYSNVLYTVLKCSQPMRLSTANRQKSTRQPGQVSAKKPNAALAWSSARSCSFRIFMKFYENPWNMKLPLFHTISDYFQLQHLTLDASRSWCCHNIMRFHGDRFVVLKTPRASKSRNVRAVTPCQWVPWTELQSWVESAHWHPEKLLHLINLKSWESPHVYSDCDFPWLYLFHPFPVSTSHSCINLPPSFSGSWNFNWRKASMNGMDSMSPIVPPSSIMPQETVWRSW